MRDSSWHRREKFVDGRHGERGQSLFLSHIIRSENEENNGESLPLIIVLGVARVEKKATMMNIRMRERERERKISRVETKRKLCEKREDDVIRGDAVSRTR